MIKEKLKLDKTSINILKGFLIYFIVLAIIFLPWYLTGKNKLYIMTNSIQIKYENRSWSKITEAKDYKLKTFDILEDGNYIGKYKLLYANKISLYENGKNVSYKGNIFAYRGSIKLDVYLTDALEQPSESDKAYINQALVNLNLSTNINISYVEKKVIDVDNDQIDDVIYAANNYSSDNSDNYFSIVFMVKNGKVTVIDSEITDKNGIYDSKIFYIKNILDIKKDKKLELLYVSNYNNGSSNSECAILFDLNKEKVIKNFCE